MSKRWYWSLALLLVFGLALVACGGADEEAAVDDTDVAEVDDAEEVMDTEEEAEPVEGDLADAEVMTDEAPEEQLYVFLPKSLDNPYWDECRIGMEDKAAELGVQAEFIGPDTADAAKQVNLFETVLARNPNGIAVSPNDPATVVDVIARARAMGIPVLSWDADSPDSQRLAYVGTDNVEAGRFAADELAAQINEEGKVAILHGSLTAANAIERVEGFEQQIAENYPNIEIVAIETTEESPATALSKAEGLLQAHPDLAAFYGVTGVGVPGAANAVNAANKCGEVVVVGFDVVPQGIEAMRNGCVQALVSQRPYGMTQQTLEMMYDMNNREWAPEQDVYDTGVTAVYQDTLDEFLETHH